jgi:hypothetical protein
MTEETKVDEAPLVARLAGSFAKVATLTRQQGISDAALGQAHMIAGCALLFDALGPAALAAHLREIADRLEVDGGAPEIH